jgi:hypothetical protein
LDLYSLGWKMKKTLKAWTALGAAMATTTAAVAASPTNRIDTPVLSAPAQPMILAAGGGEGEGGAIHEDPDVEYFSDLGLVEGHLAAGVALYMLGEAEMAKTHMKHPRDEIYADLEPMMKDRGVKGFADELSALASAVEAGAPVEEVRMKFDGVLVAIDACGAPESAADRANAVVKLVRIASDEYADGVVEGKVVEPHEYQDAYGFVQAAKRLVGRAGDDEKSEYSEEFAEITAQLAALDKAWPDLAGKSKIDTDSTLLAGAAARVELTALGMD